MIFLDGVYVDRGGKLDRFQWVKAPTTAELSQLTHTIAYRIGRYTWAAPWNARGVGLRMPSKAIWHWTSLMKTP